MTAPLFSVIIPTYGRAEFLHTAVASVLHQTIDDFECIVVDDASPTLLSLPSDERIRTIRRSENGGAAASRNTGLAAARGRYVAFLDDDDWWCPERLQIAVEGLTRAPVALCARQGSDGSHGGNRALEGDVRDVIVESLTPHLGQTAVRRDIAPFFDERFIGCQDIDWWLRVAKTTRVSTEDRIGLIYRVHSGERHKNGAHARIMGSQLLLEQHAAYFRRHRRARAFRWQRIGLMAIQLDDLALARRALVRAFLTRPHPKILWHCLHACRPGGTREPALVARTAGK